MEWVVLIIIAIIVINAIQYWHITLAIAVGIAVIILIVKANAIEKRKRAEEEARMAAEAARIRKQHEDEQARIRKHKEDQSRYKSQLVSIGDKSIAIFEKLPQHIKSAEDYLNQAEYEFSEGAFAPFWDAIEKSAKTLAHFDEGVQNIKKDSSEYVTLIPKFEGIPPQFPVSKKSVEKLELGTSSAKRMKEIVRIAQRNFQFASIYEQRKTNQILVAGFTNLAQALDSMAWQLSQSINNLAGSVDNLAGSVDSMTSSIDQSMKAINVRFDDMDEARAKHNADFAKLEAERAARERAALEMLDNIQRHRKPMI